MAGKKKSDVECCDNPVNLPDEMAEGLQRIGGLCILKEMIPDREKLSLEGKVFQALSDPIRLEILHALVVVDLCPCILKDITGLSDSKLSYHLNILEGAGLISWSARHRWRIYAVTEKGRSVLKG